MIFTDRGNNNFRVVQPTPRPINGVAGEIYQTPRLDVNIVHSRCSDGMSDRTYPDTVQVRVDGREFRGCGAPIAFFGEVGETGQPNYPGSGAMILTGTNWRVVAINGRRTPPSNFYMNFIPDRIGAKFGCNSLGAGYSVTRQRPECRRRHGDPHGLPRHELRNPGLGDPRAADEYRRRRQSDGPVQSRRLDRPRALGPDQPLLRQ